MAALGTRATAIAVASMLAMPNAAFGQNKAGDKKVDKIEVTGSHIKRLDGEGPAPVVVLDRKYLEKSGATSVGDVLRNNTTASFGSLKESSGNAWATQAHANLRGLGSTRTLILLDGKRLPSDASSGSVDLNLIPMAAIERIEVLKDGASATYGSDALGGVINLITKKDYAGAEASTKIYRPKQKGGGKEEFSVVGGASSFNTSLTTVLYYQKREPIWARDRVWSKAGENVGGALGPGKSSIGSPGSYRSTSVDEEGNPIVGKYLPDPNCPEERLYTTSAGTRCSYAYADDASIYPEMEQLSSLTNFEHRFGGKYSIFGRVGATRQRASWEFAPAPGTFPISAEVAGKLGPNGGPLPGVGEGEDIEAAYRLQELGNRRSEIETNSMNLLGGLRAQLTKGWDLEVSTSMNRVRRHDLSVTGYAVTETLEKLVADGSFNPFAAPGERGSLEEAFYQPWQLATTTQKMTEARVTGELFNLPGGAVGLALGTTAGREEYTDKFDNLSIQDKVFGNAGSSGGGSRDTSSTYAEIGLPVIEKMEIQLAGRHDKYSDFGSSTNPKVGLRYQPVQGVLLRSSYGTGFKAPSLVDVHAAESYGYPFFVDAVACEREKAANPEGELPPECRESQYLVKSGGNQGLKEERSKSLNIGMMLQPLAGLTLGLDYWRIDITNQVGIDFNDLIKAEAAGVDVAAHGVEVVRDSFGNIEQVNAPILNLAEQKTAGYDLSAEYLTPKQPYGIFGLRTDHSKLLYFREQGFPGVGFTDKLGQRGRPAWRNTTTLSYAIDKFDSALAARTIGSHSKTVAEEGKLPAYVEWDLSLGLGTTWGGKALAGATNIFAARPPLDDSNPANPLESQIYDQVGQTVYVGYKQTF
jgi:iron complex outermembrane receptor protein